MTDLKNLTDLFYILIDNSAFLFSLNLIYYWMQLKKIKQKIKETRPGLVLGLRTDLCQKCCPKVEPRSKLTELEEQE